MNNDHIKKHQDEINARIAGSYNIEKSEENELEKGGEGSKGGKVIGHTSSGKPIYARKTGKDESYKDFSHKDHEEAKKVHEEEAESHQKQIPDEAFERKGSGNAKHPSMKNRDYHNQRAFEHDMEMSRIKREGK